MKRSEKSDARVTANLDALVTAIQDRRLILFVGGGISQSLGLPDFRELVEHIALDLGFDTNRVSVSDYQVVAEAYVAKHGKLGALRNWMNTTWHPSTIDISKSEIHNLILDLDFPIIYTTNYDRWLEMAFEARGKPYHKIASMADLADFQHVGTEIIKFHGDFEDDDSLVLTETSYFQRMSFESPLDIRLRADCLARPILFIGYSLHDVNTRYLLFRLQELWNNTAYSQQRPKSFIFTVDDDPAQAAVLQSRGIEPILAPQTDPKESAKTFLRELVRRV